MSTDTPKDRFKDSAESRMADNEQDDEQDLWAGGYSGKAMYGTWVLGGLVTIGLIAGAFAFPPLLFGVPVPLIFLGVAFAYKKLSVHYELTTQRFIHKSGILKRVTDRIEVIDIDDVTYEQGLVQRMLNVGTIKISSTDRTHPELVLSGIDGVAQVADMIDDVRRKERRKRGLHIESI
ncbi:MAG: PH domain-containing protein [Planctomycetaceae bacterium]|nr:PH domain-containing protein [Planctomycetales bacterium]MCB9874088.1 PH domain-containing protein [Planctomycetaceae bacterium]MCB9937658.1 PH domain-containing protein [Planctomycetaceae bacterium]